MQPQSVLVLGASRGIGAAVARRFVSEGHNVVGTYRQGGVPDGVSPFIADITDSEQVKAAIEFAATKHGPIDTLIVSSGITRDGLLMRLSEEDIRVVMETNTIGPMLAAKAALRPMLKRRSGSIVFISSMSVKYGVPGQTNYVASKAALEGFARSMAREYAAQGIRVNVVAPGPTETDMVQAMPEDARTGLVADVPMRRLGHPDEVADVVYLTSQATFMSGATVAVGGGL